MQNIVFPWVLKGLSTTLQSADTASTFTMLTYFFINQFEILINVLLSSSFEYICYGSTAI